MERTVKGAPACNPAEQCCKLQEGVNRAPSDREVVERAFAAHRKNNPELRFDDSYKSATTTNGKPKSDRNWESSTYEIKANGRDEYVIRYTRSFNDPRYRNMLSLKDESAYYVVRAKPAGDGERTVSVTKYREFFRGKLKEFTFSENTNVGKMPATKPGQAPYVEARTKNVSFNSRGRVCTPFKPLDDYMYRYPALAAARTRSGYRASTQATDGTVYRVIAVNHHGKHIITHSQRGDGGVWKQHHRGNPAPKDVADAFVHSCREMVQGLVQR